MMRLFPEPRKSRSCGAWHRAKWQDLLADQQVAQSEIQDLNESNRGIEAQISRIRKQLADIKTQLAQVPVPVPEPVEEIIEEPEPEALTAGVEFSILGLATEAKSFVIVVDMSGSMISYTDLMIKSVLELLEPLDESNEFAIIGLPGQPVTGAVDLPGARAAWCRPHLKTWRGEGFTQSLARRFAGSTPTHYAILSAMQYPAKAIILLSDGEPDNSPGFIIQDIAGPQPL